LKKLIKFKKILFENIVFSKIKKQVGEKKKTRWRKKKTSCGRKKKKGWRKKKKKKNGIK
jgi:hypothetical protein